MDPPPSVSVVAYTLKPARAPAAWELHETEHIACAFDRGVRCVATDDCLRQDPLGRGSVTIQGTPGGVVVVVNCPEDFCAYHFAGVSPGRMLRQWEDTRMCVYPFDSWVGLTRTESVRSASAGTATLLWSGDSLYVTATIADQEPPLAQPPTEVALPAQAPAPLSSVEESGAIGGLPSYDEAGVAADLLTEVLEEIQLSPALGHDAHAHPPGDRYP
ncbi:nuclear protein UL4 [Ateline alphaherpesvirus 1]|uniref:Nuclear protein UL4 n=1 Tax=Herpesvirus ateles type 1 (strain Lennette) TaxID=35243 RepID=A0A1S6JLQ9_HSVA1|nr:nuclear protein UL4 [Ateline alphaherpesvirus 1]AQS79212.1 nuclear protein UL4 [Ateline alphaherpesvirus 1]